MSGATNKHDPAFPLPTAEWQAHGISTRQYFAAKAMESLILRLGGGPGIGNNHDGSLSHLAREAYAMADAMLSEG